MTTNSLANPEAPIRPQVGIRDAQLRVEPGQVATTEATVRNPGHIVETYEVSILGPAAAWVDPSPAAVSLFPGEEQDVSIAFVPPMSSRLVAGTYAVGVQATSRVRPESTATTEVVVTVPPFYRFRIIAGQTAYTVRTKATMLVRVVNEGNSTVTYQVQAEDPEGFLSVKPKNPQVTLKPGESRWVEVQVKVAPKIIGSGFDTRSFLVTVTPIRDEDLQLPLLDEDSEELGASVVHRPFIRVRLGVLGRLILVLTILGLIAGFFFARWVNSNRPPTDLAPSVPAEFYATLAPNQRDVILTWDSSPGATSYAIYAVGATGDPVPAPTPTVIVEQPAGSVAARSGRIPRADSNENLGTRPSPVCENCSAVTETPSGVSRFVVENVPAGLACYRIAAKTGVNQSLFSQDACTTVPDPASIDLDGNGVPDAQEAADDASANLPRPCPPVNVAAQAMSPTSIAIVWKQATEPPAGFQSPAPTTTATPTVPTAAADGLRGGPIGPDKPTTPSTSTSSTGQSSGKVRVCDPSQEITSWLIQRRILTGWSNIAPEPAATDTAVEIRDLTPATEYCFRMRAVSAEGNSRFTKRFCAATLEDPNQVSSVSPATPSQQSDPTGTTAPPSAAVVIEDLGLS